MDREKRKVRIRNGFSDRNGFDPISREIQSQDFSADTRISLFNSLKNVVEHQIACQRIDRSVIARIIVERLFNDVYDDYRDGYVNVWDEIYEVFVNDEYHVLLTIIEFLCNFFYEDMESFLSREPNNPYRRWRYIDPRKQLNEAFENEFVGYRFIEDKIVPITNEAEIDSINGSLKTPYERVNESISKAVGFLSETGSKDYPNSIKESITALEQLVNVLNGSSGLVLSNAVEQLCAKLSIDENLKESIKRLFKYASDANGVRHGNNKDNGDISFDEAKIVLVICSAIINYLVSIKANGRFE